MKYLLTVFIASQMGLSAYAASTYRVTLSPTEAKAFQTVTQVLEKELKAKFFTESFRARPVAEQTIDANADLRTLSDVCKNTPDASLKLARIEYRMQFSDISQATLYKKQFLVCDSTSSPSFVLRTYSAEAIVEPNLRMTVQNFPGQDHDDDCDTDRVSSQRVCLTEGYEISGWDEPRLIRNQEGSVIQAVTPVPGKPQCLEVSYTLKGRGYDRIMGAKVNCNGSAYISFDIMVYGVSHQPH